jgi:DNA repair protein RadC
MARTQTMYTTTDNGSPNATTTTAPAAARPARWFAPQPATTRTEVTSPDAAASVLLPHLTGLDREACVAAYLDTKHRLLGTELISLGSLDHTFMSPRDIYRGALQANAAATVVAHNHPSGDPEPSRDDEALTRRLTRAGELIGIELLDHLVAAGERWVSLARRGAL